MIYYNYDNCRSTKRYSWIKTGGKPVSKIPNFYSMLYQAMLMVKSQVDLPSSIRTQQLVNPIYSDVDYYVVPSDLGMMAIINLRPIKPDTSYYDYHNFHNVNLLLKISLILQQILLDVTL